MMFCVGPETMASWETIFLGYLGVPHALVDGEMQKGAKHGCT